MRYDVTGIPDDLAEGTYATRVKDAIVDGEGVLITLEYTGEIDPHNPPLFTLTKHADGTVN